jgi:hypothetical protein
MLRGKLGRYLTAIPEDCIALPPLSSPTASTTSTTTTATAASRVYPLGVMGQGVGSSLDCITFVNIENK